MYVFELNDVEQKNAEREALDHRKECMLSTFTYTFNPNGGIGVSSEMTCLQCGKKFNITDYDSW
jgi:hypothetical protein